MKWNDCAGESTINLGKHYKKAYKRNIVLKLYESKKGAAANREKKRQDGIKVERDPIAILDDGEDIPDEENAPTYTELPTQDNNNTVVNKAPLIEKDNTNAVINHDSDDDDTDDESADVQMLSTQLIKVL